jgi:hypothetical protein
MVFGRYSSLSRAAVTTGLALLVSSALAGLAGCTAGGSTSVTSSPAPTPTVAPTFVPAGTADDNLEYFRWIVTEAISREGENASTEALAKKLAASGFAAEGIQFSDNSTAIGLKPDSVTVAALVADKCLIAQYGPSIGGLTVSVQPVLASGGCLLGRSLNHL